MPTAGTGEIISGLQLECYRQAENPPSVDGEPDKYISMFGLALGDCLSILPDESQEKLATAVNVKRSKGRFESDLIFNHILRSSQMYLTRNKLPYPYETQEEWNEQVAGLVFDKDKFQSLATNMWMWNVGSDVETRVAGIKLVAHTLLRQQVDDEDNPFKILNIGSARNHSLAMLSGNVALPEVGVAGKGLDLRKQKFIQGRVNELLATEITLGDSYGVDMKPLRDMEWAEFLKACRFYPSELSDPEKLQMYEHLEGIRDADLRLHHADGVFGEDKFEFGTRFNLVAYMTSLYQSYPDMQRNMVDEGMEHGDYMMIQDFCRIKSTNNKKHPIDQLEFSGPSSRPYTYGLFVYDPKKPELGVQTLGYWNNGRCEIFMPSPLFIDLLDD